MKAEKNDNVRETWIGSARYRMRWRKDKKKIRTVQERNGEICSKNLSRKHVQMKNHKRKKRKLNIKQGNAKIRTVQERNGEKCCKNLSRKHALMRKHQERKKIIYIKQGNAKIKSTGKKMKKTQQEFKKTTCKN